MQIAAQGSAAGKSTPLAFDGPLLIVGGGAVDRTALLAMAERVVGSVGADSGADALWAAGLVPDAVIGDMDSVIDPARFGPGTRVIALADQMTTDFEKCLEHTRAPLTIVMGMTGERFDHMLAALHAVARHAPHRRIVLIDSHDLALGVSGGGRFAVGKGARVSIYPLGRTGFARSEGLLYPLNGLVMEQGQKIGTSNMATEDSILVETAEGPQDPWLLIVARESFDTLFFPSK